MLGSDFDVTGTETVRQTGQLFLEKRRTDHHLAAQQLDATPLEVARDITGLALRYHPGGDITFLEPCVGSGTFFSALLHDVAPHGTNLKLEQAHGVEPDTQFAALAHDLWAPAGLTVHDVDFMGLQTADLPQATLVLSRPPTTPHHRLTSEQKIQAADTAQHSTGLRPTGLADVYNHFVLATHQYLAPHAVSAWLLPTAFLGDTAANALRTYLANRVQVHRIHRFDGWTKPAGTHDHNWTVVVFTNTTPDVNQSFEFTSGGELFGAEHSTTVTAQHLQASHQWNNFLPTHPIPTRKHPTLDDFFHIRRGWDVPGEKFFIQPETHAWALGIQPHHMVPMLPPPQHVTDTVIRGDAWGYPETPNRQVVLTSHDDYNRLHETDPSFLQYLKTATQSTRAAAKRPETPLWYSLHVRAPAPILVQRATKHDAGPYRFIRNESDGVAGPGWLTMSPNTGFLTPWFIQNDVDWDALISVLTTLQAPHHAPAPELSPNALASLDATPVQQWLATFQ